ncbi:MAG: Trm112 family protein [Magnetococcales bacterium]|nr:Trm112 family protein [Magnetococcales bacterium]
MIDSELMDILVCPQCKGGLELDLETKELICRPERLAFPIRDEIPVMLLDEARQIPAE